MVEVEVVMMNIDGVGEILIVASKGNRHVLKDGGRTNLC